MSNPFQHTVQPQPSKYGPGAPAETNGLAITGFVISLVGLLFCGVPSAIGLIVSVVALGKQPRGFAVAGVVLGVIGVLVTVACGVLMFATYRTAMSVGNSIGVMASQVQADMDAGVIGKQWQESGELPSQDAGQKLLKAKSDLFGNPFSYETDGTSFTIRSAGPDGKDGTEDDIVSGPFQDAQSAIDEAPERDENGDMKFDVEGFESGQSFDGIDFESDF